ncbi:hypothetical protein GCM10009639_52280 [Kitasatospora putterlickiae]|uniref:ATP/GTP-binding protein n=1 Tax=Kitasatospora putterlickiae TaxID=221725 RepID=A0ABN1YD94_9ACTN
MLKPVRRLVIGTPLFAGLLLAPTGPAAADPPGPTGGATQCEINIICREGGQQGSTPAPSGGGSHGGGGGTSGSRLCVWNGQVLACSDPELGWFSATNGCYYRVLNPQPEAGDPSWENHDPKEGSVYNVTCRSSDGSVSSPEPKFLAQAPVPAPPDPGAEADRYVHDELHFQPPTLGVAPKKDPVVGGNVWLWLADPKKPATEPLTLGGLTVTVTPRVASVKWDLGDGTKVTCKGAAAVGTPYDVKYGANPSPTCGHVFKSGSGTKKDGVFTGSVEVVWMNDVTVSDGTKVDPIEIRVTAERVSFRVAEVQVLN